MRHYKAISKWQAKNGRTLGYRLLRYDNVIIDMLTVDIKKYLEANGVNAITNLTLTSDGRLIYSKAKNRTVKDPKTIEKSLRNKIKKSNVLGLLGYVHKGVCYYTDKEGKIHCTALGAFNHGEIADNITRNKIISIGKYDEVVKILPGTQVVDNWAFTGLEDIKKILLPDGLLKIGEGAFYSCPHLSAINIPLSVTEIGKSAFDSSYNIRRLTFNVGVLNNSICAYNHRLANVTLTDKVTIIGEKAFNLCTGLVRIKIPKSVKVIRSQAFRCCEYLRDVEISGEIKFIDDSAFEGCKGLSGESRIALRNAGYNGKF